jgi:microcystin-dependent protein
VPGAHAGHLIYGAPASESLPADTVGNAGGAQPHENMQPYLTTIYCIALVGIFPPRD